MTEQQWRCGRCKTEKLASEFPPNGDPLTMVKRPAAYTCRACVREGARARYQRLKALRPPRPPRPEPKGVTVGEWRTIWAALIQFEADDRNAGHGNHWGDDLAALIRKVDQRIPERRS